MEPSSENKGFRKIDVKEVLQSKNPSLAKAIPSFVINYLKRTIHQDELNYLLTNYGHLKDAEFVEASLNFFKIKYKVFGQENIPSDYPMHKFLQEAWQHLSPVLHAYLPV